MKPISHNLILLIFVIFTSFWPTRICDTQGSNPKIGQMPFPIIPIIGEYEYASQYFMQWITENPNYSMIEGIISMTTPPVYQVILTEKESKKKLYYCNSEAKIKGFARNGKLARRAEIDFRTSKQIGQMTAYAFGFRDATGQAIP